jgi:hypothetical protein
MPSFHAASRLPPCRFAALGAKAQAHCFALPSVLSPPTPARPFATGLPCPALAALNSVLMPVTLSVPNYDCLGTVLCVACVAYMAMGLDGRVDAGGNSGAVRHSLHSELTHYQLIHPLYDIKVINNASNSSQSF